VAVDWKKISTARTDLNKIIERAHYTGLITVITMGKRDMAAIVPLTMVQEYQELIAKVPPLPADTMVEDAQRTELPQEVSAHSSWDEQLDDQLADLLSGHDDGYDGQEHIEDE